MSILDDIDAHDRGFDARALVKCHPLPWTKVEANREPGPGKDDYVQWVVYDAKRNEVFRPFYITPAIEGAVDFIINAVKEKVERDGGA